MQLLQVCFSNNFLFCFFFFDKTVTNKKKEREMSVKKEIILKILLDSELLWIIHKRLMDAHVMKLSSYLLRTFL